MSAATGLEGDLAFVLEVPRPCPPGLRVYPCSPIAAHPHIQSSHSSMLKRLPPAWTLQHWRATANCRVWTWPSRCPNPPKGFWFSYPSESRPTEIHPEPRRLPPDHPHPRRGRRRPDPSLAGRGRCSAPENTLEGEGSMVLRRTVCGEAVERSAGRRRTVDSSPFHTQQKEQQTALLGHPTPFRSPF